MMRGSPLVGGTVVALLLLAGLLALIANVRDQGFRRGFLGNNWVQAMAMYVFGLAAMIGLFVYVVPLFGR